MTELAMTWLAEYAFTHILDNLSQSINNLLIDKELRLRKNFSENIKYAFENILNATTTWSNEMEYKNGGQQLRLSKLYVDLDLYVQPISFLEEEKNKRIKFDTILSNATSHLVILGRPGTGKTTTIKALCYKLLRGESVLNGYEPIPIVIKFREIDNSISIYDTLMSLLNIQITNINDGRNITKSVDINIKENIIHRFFNSSPYILIFDGFDEIENEDIEYCNKVCKRKDKFINEFKSLCLNINNSLIILTSRTAEYNFFVSNTSTYELSTLTEEQIKLFLSRYISDMTKYESSIDIIINKKLLGAEFIPLTLTYLCLLINKYGKLFNSRREIYNKLLDLLLDDWDHNRGINYRKSNYSDFDTYDKKRFLKQLSYELSTRYNRIYFTEIEVEYIYNTIYQDFDYLNKKERKLVLEEIESHTGLFLKAGDGYIFSHKTIQEYLFATYFIEFPEIPNDKNLLIRFPNELALAISLNENPSLYFSYLVMGRFDSSFYDESFFSPFIDRLMLEGTKFKVHPYLGIAYLLMYDNIKHIRKKQLIPENYVKRQIKKFYKFMDTDKRITLSLNLLRGKYEIHEERKRDDVFFIKKKEDFYENTAYMEPQEMCVSYVFYHYFLD